MEDCHLIRTKAVISLSHSFRMQKCSTVIRKTFMNRLEAQLNLITKDKTQMKNRIEIKKDNFRK